MRRRNCRGCKVSWLREFFELGASSAARFLGKEKRREREREKKS